MMRRWLFPAFGTAALCCCAGFSALTGSGAPRYKPGVYEGTGQGFRGPLRAAVSFDETGINGIEILEHEEDPSVGGAAMEELLELILDTGSTDVDGISGATESSSGLLEAVEEALRQAGNAAGRVLPNETAAILPLPAARAEKSPAQGIEAEILLAQPKDWSG